ncbi:hypothetical protein, partial [Streptomyces sp. IBTA2]|uniref:hypothetical protein n=1 Tax=Streptomyces sp. IBTA2 TaxID=2283625 RepID=UPI001F6059C6
MQTDADVDAGVTERQRVGVALAAVTENRDLAALDDGQVGIVVVEQLGHWVFSLVCRCCVPPYGGGVGFVFGSRHASGARRR